LIKEDSIFSPGLTLASVFIEINKIINNKNFDLNIKIPLVSYYLNGFNLLYIFIELENPFSIKEI